MIIPLLSGIFKFSRTPVTWILFGINLLLFLSFSLNQEYQKNKFDKLMKNQFFLASQGLVYAKFILKDTKDQPSFLIRLAEAAVAGNKDQLEMLGQLSIRNTDFLNNALDYEYDGDQVEVNYWRKNFKELLEIHNSDVSYMLGYGGYKNESSFMNTLSYQFIHGGFLHLISNMWFLLIFGSFVEVTMGSTILLITFLLTGIGAAFSFTFLTGDSAIPLVGASGSISGIMGLYLIHNWNKKARCMFWLLPVKGYSGFAELPAWIVMGIWFISDLSGYLGNLSEMGGVAHAAHLGGLFLGIFSGLIFFRRKSTSQSVFNNASGF